MIERYININWILILVTTTGYGYVLTLDGGALSWKYVKILLFYHDLLCKDKLFLFQCILTIKLLYLKFLVKMSMKNWHIRMRDKCIYKLNYSWCFLSWLRRVRKKYSRSAYQRVDASTRIWVSRRMRLKTIN